MKLRDGTVLGWTDRYGRLTVNTLASGEHTVEVVHGNETSTARLTVDGEQGLKVIYLDD